MVSIPDSLLVNKQMAECFCIFCLNYISTDYLIGKKNWVNNKSFCCALCVYFIRCQVVISVLSNVAIDLNYAKTRAVALSKSASIVSELALL